jgi:predicted adenine nucleotide alpha hydrolase (AANH) superfamily ATPase
MLLNPSELPKGRLLLHSCCAPCSGAIVEALAEAYRQAGRDPAEEMAIFWSNSNICDKEEYDKRKAEILRYAREFGIEVIDDDYDHSEWLAQVARGREDAPERGPRCLECFAFRLARAARYASEHGFGTLTTSLASSRWKSLDQINAAGLWAEQQANSQLPIANCHFWAQNWRKGGLQQRRNELLRQYDFYNQLYCGCEFSIQKAD